MQSDADQLVIGSKKDPDRILRALLGHCFWATLSTVPFCIFVFLVKCIFCSILHRPPNFYIAYALSLSLYLAHQTFLFSFSSNLLHFLFSVIHIFVPICFCPNFSSPEPSLSLPVVYENRDPWSLPIKMATFADVMTLNCAHASSSILC